MNFVVFLLITTLNWAIKLGMAWVAYHFTHWLFVEPAEWVVIAIVAVAVVTTSINISWTDSSGRKWSVF